MVASPALNPLPSSADFRPGSTSCEHPRSGSDTSVDECAWDMGGGGIMKTTTTEIYESFDRLDSSTESTPVLPRELWMELQHLRGEWSQPGVAG